MPFDPNKRNRRILLVDDNPSIHEDYRKVLTSPDAVVSALDVDEDFLFGDGPPRATGLLSYELVSAHQGDEALELVEQALAENRPFAVAIVDMRMPPGWDGLETVARLWLAAPNLLVIFCTALSDYSWSAMVDKLGVTDRFMILKKPFDAIEVLQMVAAMVERRHQASIAQLSIDDLWEQQRRIRELENELVELQRRLRQEAGSPSTGPRVAGVILVADAIPGDGPNTLRRLEAAGAAVALFEDGQDLVNEFLRLRATGIETAGVVLELALPDLDGFQTTKTLRELGFSGPIVAWSSQADPADRADAIVSGCSAHVSKVEPFDMVLQALAQGAPVTG